MSNENRPPFPKVFDATQIRDFRGCPHKFFLKEAKVAMNDGATFGQGGEDFVRLNFGCPRSTLEQALGRMQEALWGLGS